MADERIRLERADAFAEQKHAGQWRIGGAPYITHPRAVAQIVAGWGMDIDAQIAALFHDLLEDTDAAEAEIGALGGAEVLEVVKRLTKQDGYVMQTYVAEIKTHPIARAVKAADRLHNLRCALCADEEFRRKYIRETVDWYMDLCPEIPEAVRQLAQSLETPIEEYPFLYE